MSIMNSYRNHIVDVLVENICLNRNDLFAKLGMTNRREFRTMVDRLLTEKRIRYEDDIYGGGPVLSPKVLKLVECQNRCGTLTRTFTINYTPTNVLEKVVEYVKPGIDPYEDKLDFHLEIMGYKLEEKYKAFFEQENDFTLDYSKFNYTLYAEYLFPKYADLSPHPVNIILIDEIEESANTFMESMKLKVAPFAKCCHFNNNYDAAVFLENTFINKTIVSIIIFRCRGSKHIQDFLSKIESIINQYKNDFLSIYLPVLILTEPDSPIDETGFVQRPGIGCMYYPYNEDEAILGNIIQTQCKRSQ